MGVIFDSVLRLILKKITTVYFYHLCNIAKIGSFLSLSDAGKLINAFVSSRLDYCNALFAGLPYHALSCLRLVQNAAARVLTRTKNKDCITPVLASLHWLPVRFRIDFKISLLTYKALNGLAPYYLKEILSPYKPLRTLSMSTP